MKNVRYACALVLAAMVAVLVSAGQQVSTASAAVGEYPTSEGSFYAGSARMLDTRYGLGTGGRKTPVGPDGTINLQVSYRGSVPGPAEVSAVVLNVTSTGSTAGSYFTVWPTGKARPSTSAINFARGETRANLVTVPLGVNGQVSLFNKYGSVHMIADLVGYYRKAGGDTYPAGSFYPVAPARIYDSRQDPAGAVASGESFNLTFDYGFDMQGVQAVAVNVTAVNAAGPGFIRVWNGGGGEQPRTSTLNYAQGSVTPNVAIVNTTLCGCGGGQSGGYFVPQIGVANWGSSVHVVVDIVGFYDDTAWEANGWGATRFKPLENPLRIVDTRSGLGTTAIGSGQTRSVLTPASVAGAETVALASNMTAVRPTAYTYLVGWAEWTGETLRPEVSNLNAAAGAVVANHAVLGVGDTSRFKVFNAAGWTNVLIDVSGTFELYGPPTNARRPSDGRRPLEGSPVVTTNRS